MQTSGNNTTLRDASPHVWLAPETPDLIWFSGADAVRFLNDLISQEIGSMTSGEVRRSFLLGPQGKLDHILWVVRSGDRVGLITDPGRGEELVATLGRYRVRVDVEIKVEDQPAWLVMGEWEGIDVSWEDVRRVLVVGDRPDLPDGTLADYESARIQAGEPKWGAEATETTIPHETGLVPLSVDFTKGCFLGQELVARIDSRGGSAPRSVRWIDLANETPAGVDLLADGSVVGTLTSVTDRLGLGLVHRKVSPGETVAVGSTTGVVREITRNPQT
jgi:folate-binding protein YgfZ